MTRPAILLLTVTLAACGASSPTPSAPTAADPRFCTTDADCVLVQIPCCGTCGPWRTTDFDSVRRENEEIRQHELCSEPVACPECVVPEVPADIIAICRASRCSVAATTRAAEPATS